MSTYIVSMWGPGCLHSTQDMAYVEAPDEQEAARLGAILLQGMLTDNGSDDVDVDGVFVHLVDGWTVFDIVPAAELSAMQCCGGAATEHGHSGYCVSRQRDESGGAT